VIVVSLSLTCFVQTAHLRSAEFHLVDQPGVDGNKESLTQEQARELIDQGARALSAGDYANALAAFGRAKDVAESLGDQAGLAEALAKLGNVLRLQGNYAEALKHLQRSIALSDARG